MVREQDNFSLIPATSVDRLLAVGGIVVGILLFLYGKTPAVVVILSAGIFALLLHPLCNLAWIKDYTGRRIIAAIALAGVCILTGYGAWPSADIQQKKLDEMQRKLDEITRLLKEQNPKATPEALQQKYSKGYVIGKLTPDSPALPYQNRLATRYNVNWSSAYVKDNKDGSVDVGFPDFNIPSVSAVFMDNVVTLPKTVGARQSLGAAGISEFVEVLAVSPDGGVIVLFGFTG